MNPSKERNMLKTKLADPRIETSRPLFLAGFQQTYSMKAANDLSQQWQRFVLQVPKLPGKGGRVAYGVIFHVSGAENFAYLTAIEISDSIGLSCEFSSISIPAQQYAIFLHTGHVSEIKDTIREIWDQWLPSSGYSATGNKPGSVTMIERYGEGFDPKTGMGDIELWIPVRN
jgi:AraC family transcriptional regulator